MARQVQRNERAATFHCAKSFKAMSEYCKNCAGVAERYEDQVDRLSKRIAQLESQNASLTAEVMHYTAGTPHPRVADLEVALREIAQFTGYKQPTDSSAWSVFMMVPEDLRTALETAAYCAPCEDGECAVHPSTMNRGAVK